MRRTILALLALAVCLATLGYVQTRAEPGSFKELSRLPLVQVGEAAAPYAVTYDGNGSTGVNCASGCDQSVCLRKYCEYPVARRSGQDRLQVCGMECCA